MNAATADLYALPDGFDWIVNDFAQMDRVVDDTLAEYAAEIEAERARHAGRLDPSRVTFVWGTDESTLFAVTDLRSDRRREA